MKDDKIEEARKTHERYDKWIDYYIYSRNFKGTIQAYE
jgi:hypothetical protein